ncbi:MAG: GNAT family N-acetyltransferase [Archangium sp.]
MPVTVQQLAAQDSDALRALLAKDPAHNLYLLGLLQEFGIGSADNRCSFSYWGRFDGKTLTAAAFVGGGGGLVVPSASDGTAMGAIADALAERVRLKASVGEKPAVDALVRGLCALKPRLSKTYRLFSVSADDLGPFTNPLLRLAREEELPRLMPLAAGAVREIHDRDALAEDPNFEARVAQRVRARRTYVLEENGELVFKVDIGSRSQFGAELEGLYTVPAQRRKGHATLCLGQISRFLLSSLPRLTLRVEEKGESLARIARKVGYLAGRTQRLVLME